MHHASLLPAAASRPALTRAVPSLASAGAAAQVPFQRYSIAAEDGSPVFVDPALFALALRLPLKDCIQHGLR